MTRHRHLFSLVNLSVLFLLSGCDSELPQSVDTALPPASTNHELQKFAQLAGKASQYIDREWCNPTAGLMVPLSGESAPLGEAIVKASMLAFSELGIDTCRLRVVDTQGTTAGARAAAQELVKAGTKIVLGPVFAQEAQAAAPVFARNHIPMVVFSNHPNVAQKNVFVFGLNPEDEISALLAFGITQSARRFAAIVPEGEYGEVVLRAINVTLAERQRHIFAAGSHQRALQLEVIRYRSGETRAEEMTQRCSTLFFDAAIVLEQDSEVASMLITVLRKRQEDALILGSSTWKEAAFIFLPEAEGVYIALPAQEGSNAFEERYKKTFERHPVSLISVLAFDATTILAYVNDFSALTPEWFVDESGFLGLMGEAHFTKSGHVHRTLHVHRIKNCRLLPERESQTFPQASARSGPSE